MLLSYCGLNCKECGAYIATKYDDNDLRKKVSEEWSKLYNVKIKPEDINCTGCTQAGGIKFFHCENTCQIRKCAKEKEVKNCAHCKEYVCPKLQEFFDIAPEAKSNLENIRRAL